MTRRERNARAGVPEKSKVAHIPFGMEYFLEWFWELRSYTKDREDPISPGLMTDWAHGKGILLYPWQRDTLHEMDCRFRLSLAEEIAANEKRRIATEQARGNNRRK